MAKAPQKSDTSNDRGQVDAVDVNDDDIADAEDEEQDAGPSTPLSARENLIESMVSARQDDLREDGVDIDDDDKANSDRSDDESGAPGGSDDPDDESGEDGGETGDAPATGASPATAEKITIKVNGEERQVTLEELTRGYSMAAGAEARMEQANQRYREAEEIENRVRTGGADQRSAAEKDDVADQPAATKENVLDQIDWSKAAQDIQMGDPEQAAQALRDTVEQAVTRLGVSDPEATMRQVGEAVEGSIRREFAKREMDSALSDFQSEYSDVIETPELATLSGNFAKEEFQRAREEHAKNGTPLPSFADVLKRAGERTRKFVTGIRGPVNDDNSGNGNETDVKMDDALSSRQDMKRQSPQQPAARRPARRQSTREDVVPDETTRAQSGISDIMKSRGQVSANS